MKIKITLIALFLPLVSWAQASASRQVHHEGKTDRDTSIQSTESKAIDHKESQHFFLNLIPFDSAKAQQDIQLDTIRIITLASDTRGNKHGFSVYLSPDQIKNIEAKFGVAFRFFNFTQIPQYYLDIRESEYNRQVYQYLDKKLSGDSRQMINDEMIKLAKLNMGK
jgi:hypothetical protein